MVRPREELAGLIKEDIEQGENAGIEFYRAAGEKLKEAKAQTKVGEWNRWLRGNVGISYSTARAYMALADDFEFREAIPGENGRQWKNLSEFTDHMLGRKHGHRPKWHDPVAQAMPGKRATEQFHARRRTSSDEKHLTHQLGSKLIDIGYRALATQLHPDHGGSEEGMSRLNRVRDLLKGALK
jgi:hypothetical protein